MPKRIQLRRTKGWRKPAGTVVVSRPSKWGNPYVIETRDGYEGRFIVRDARTGDVLCVCGTKEEARRDATFLFRDELATRENLLRFTVEDVRRELRDKDLACWCPLPAQGEEDHCHAAVLLRIANWGEGPAKRLKVTSKVTCFVEAPAMYEAAEAVDEALRRSSRILDFGAEHSVVPAKDSEWPGVAPTHWAPLPNMPEAGQSQPWPCVSTAPLSGSKTCCGGSSMRHGRGCWRRVTE